MPNVNVISENAENKTLSSSYSVASITETIIKPLQDGQSKIVSAASGSVTTIKRTYGSMPNLTASITTGDDTAAIEALTAFAYNRFPSNRCSNIARNRLNWQITPDRECGMTLVWWTRQWWCHQLPRVKSRSGRRPSHPIGRFLQQNQNTTARANRMLRWAEIWPVVRREDYGVQCRT